MACLHVSGQQHTHFHVIMMMMMAQGIVHWEPPPIALKVCFIQLGVVHSSNPPFQGSSGSIDIGLIISIVLWGCRRASSSQ